MIERRCYRFAYHSPSHKDRERLPFQMRDGDASLFLMDALSERGYRYAGPIFNYPSAGPELIPVDYGFLRRTDLILLTTRPPMHDLLLGDRKGFERSFTTLEEELFRGPMRERFQLCARSEVLLTDDTARISPEIGKRQSLGFRQTHGAGYQYYGSPTDDQLTRFPENPSLSAAFLLYTEHAWRGGPAFLAAFGIGGTETLVWCHSLATRFKDLLCTTPFAMAELRRGELPERPMTMDFAASWETTILGTADRKSA